MRRRPYLAFAGSMTSATTDCHCLTAAFAPDFFHWGYSFRAELGGGWSWKMRLQGLVAKSSALRLSPTSALVLDYRFTRTASQTALQKYPGYC